MRMYDEIFCMQAPNFHDNHLSERFFPHEYQSRTKRLFLTNFLYRWNNIVHIRRFVIFADSFMESVTHRLCEIVAKSSFEKFSVKPWLENHLEHRSNFFWNFEFPYLDQDSICRHRTVFGTVFDIIVFKSFPNSSNIW